MNKRLAITAKKAIGKGKLLWLDCYNDAIYETVSPTLKTTTKSSEMNFIMEQGVANENTPPPLLQKHENYKIIYHGNMDKNINVITLFSGYDSQCLALNRLGLPYELAAWCEIDKHAITAHNALFPQWSDRNLGDVSKVDWVEWHKQHPQPIDLLTYSSPCFVKGTLILTRSGYKPIEDITTQDIVLTHKNRYCNVVRIGHKPSTDIVFLKGMMFDTITCTGNHPFYAREMSRKGHYSVRVFANPQWVEARNLTKKHYLGYAINRETSLPLWDGTTDNRWGHEKTVNKLYALFQTGSFWYLMGRYVGDGWKKNSGNGKGIVVCCSDRNRESLLDAIKTMGLNVTVSNERTVSKCTICSKELNEFVDRYGYYAHGKRIDAETMNLPIDLLRRFVDGLIDSDGCYTNNEFKITTVSRELAYGIQQCVAKVYRTHCKINKCVRLAKYTIEGREVNQRDTYSVSWHTERRKQDHAFYEDGYIWFPLSKIEMPNAIHTVYNIEVDTDHSYTANGAIVHNCQDFSSAGLQRGGEEGSGTRSGLLWETERAVRELRPQYLVFENVAGLVSDKFIELFQRWQARLNGYGYTNFSQLMNAKDYGVPQNRLRIFMVSVLDCQRAYYFPKPFRLERRLKDVLEQNVDERYYLSDERVAKLMQETAIHSDRGNGFAFRPHTPEEIASTVKCSGIGDKTDNFVAEPKVEIIADLNPDRQWQGVTRQQNKVVSIEGIAPACTAEHNSHPYKIAEPQMLGWTRNEKGEITDRHPVSVANCVTAAKRDNTQNYVMEPTKRLNITKDGTLELLRGKDGKRITTEVYTPSSAEYAPTILTDNNHCKIYEPTIAAMRGRDKDNPNDRGKSTDNYAQRLEPKQDGTSNTLTSVAKDNYLMEPGIRIRRLTERELFRLMDVDEADIDTLLSAGIAKTQLTKLAGNSVVCACYYHIFRKLFIDTNADENEQLQLF